MFCSKEDPDCTSEFRLNNPDGRCVERIIVDVEDLRNPEYIRNKLNDETFYVNSTTYYCLLLPEAETLANISGSYNETTTVTANYTILDFEPAPPPR